MYFTSGVFGISLIFGEERRSDTPNPFNRIRQPIGDRVDRASATEAVDSGSIPGRSNQRL